MLAADLDKSVRKGGPFPYRAEAFLPEEAWRGELAERWEWEDPLTLVIKLREGIFYPDKPGVMKAREFVADRMVERAYADLERGDGCPRQAATAGPP